jgi:hypothetical protein
MSTLSDRERALLAEPSLEGLAYALRNLKRLLPEHRWSYGCHGSCALGVARTLWFGSSPFDGETDRKIWTTIDAIALFDMTDRQAWATFITQPYYCTPEHVATVIERVIAERAEATPAEPVLA